MRENPEEKYLDQFIALANLNDCSGTLKDKLREFDHLYNVTWPLVHLEIAKHYLDLKEVTKAAIGDSEWKQYLHPKFQQRKFSPTLWHKAEIANYVTNH